MEGEADCINSIIFFIIINIQMISLFFKIKIFIVNLLQKSHY